MFARSGCISILVVGVLVLSTLVLFAHDKRYPVTPQQRAWFDTLRSGKGPCCSAADGNVLTDLDWESRDGHYRVRIDDQWIDVPDDAVLIGPNLYGPTMVWPVYTSQYGGPLVIQVRCFMPGTMT